MRFPVAWTRWWRAAALLTALAAGAAVRLAPWDWVLGGPEVRLTGDGDPLYHLLQAERLGREPLATTWRDPALNWPAGADVPWPPLFDEALRAAGWLAAGGVAPDRAALLLGGAFLPVALGLLAIAWVARLGRALLGDGHWVDASAVLALLPSHALFTVLGRPDQHAAEPVVAGLVMLAAARIAAGGGRGPAALLAAALAAGFWTWSGSALFLALVAGFAALWHATAPRLEPGSGRGAAWLAAGLLGGAATIAVTLAAFGPPGALAASRVTGITGLQPALCVGAAAACGLVALHRRGRPAAGALERVAAAAAALLLPVAALALWPWSCAGFSRGVDMLAAVGWYRSIVEFQPLLLGGTMPLRQDLTTMVGMHGLAPLAVLAALPLLWRRARASRLPERPPLLLAGVLFGGTLALALARNRFAVYLSVAEALAVALVARAVASSAARRWPARRWAGPAAGVALAGAVLAPVLPGLREAPWATRTLARHLDLAPLLRFAAALPAAPGREAILAPWSFGHEVRWFSGRPVVSSPFGVEGGEGALEDDAVFHFEVDPEAAERLLAQRRVGLVLVSAPLDEVISLAGFAPRDRPPVVRLTRGPVGGIEARVQPAFAELVAARLHLFDGMSGEVSRRWPPRAPALGGFRLVAESRSQDPWLSSLPVPSLKLFQVVAGVEVRVAGAAPGAVVYARTRLLTNAGRRISFEVHGMAGPDGTARLRLPYATGQNGLVTAAPWLLSDEDRRATLVVSGAEVVLGAVRDAALQHVSPPRRAAAGAQSAPRVPNRVTTPSPRNILHTTRATPAATDMIGEADPVATPLRRRR